MPVQWAVSMLPRHAERHKAISAARRIDEVKHFRNKAEAVRIYPKQAGDLQLHNQAAEIRLFAERRAGQLLSDMMMHPGTRGEGRPRGHGTKASRSSCATAYPPSRDEILRLLAAALKA